MSTELSMREREILNAVYDGRTFAEIADAAGIAESTVQWHIANTRRKLRASSSAEAMVKAYRRGLLDEPPHSSSLAHLRTHRVRGGTARAIADATMRWMIAAVLVLVALIGISGAVTATPLFRFEPPRITPTLVAPATSAPRP